MRRSMIHEAEHRRGLVLGFTLAEVLLLLLFLLLLALGARVVRLEREQDATPDQARAELHSLREKLAAVAPLLQDAARISPHSPPEPLKRGLELVRRFGLDRPADQLRAVTPELASVIDDAAGLDPQGPAAPLRAGLSVLQNVKAGGQPQDMERITRGLADLMKEAARRAPDDPVALLSRALAAWIAAQDTGHPQASGRQSWPPIIALSEAEGYFFGSGSAELSPAFQATLSQVVVGRLLDIVREYDVNVVEVVGHTDELPLAGNFSNLDKTLRPYLQGQASDRLTPSDNAGLGLARAVAVVRALSADHRMKGLRIIPLSGAQLIDTGDRLSVGQDYAVKQRRRIEIRVRRSDREAVAELPDPAPPPDPTGALRQPSVPAAAPPKEPPAVPAVVPPREAPRAPAPKPRDNSACSGIAGWSDPSCR